MKSTAQEHNKDQTCHSLEKMKRVQVQKGQDSKSWIQQKQL